MGNSFFVDMNLIFEKFVTRLFKDFYNSEYFVEDQKNKKAWITDEGAYTNIRTDILLSSPTGKKIVIDTKYKRKISQTDSFQIFFYVHEYNEKKVLIRALWDVAFADGRIDKYEDHTIRKIADLIYVKHEDFMKAKHR